MKYLRILITLAALLVSSLLQAGEIYIDAPEKKQDFGRVSGDHLRQMLRGRTVSSEAFYKDKYRRTVTLVWLGTSRLINEAMVNYGLAWTLSAVF